MQQKGEVQIKFFSEKTSRYYRLIKVQGDLPCLEISGIKMHCAKEGIGKTTRDMVKAIQPLEGNVLDTCFGLGYTAIEISRSPNVGKVYTFENDLNVMKIAGLNGKSKEAFSNPKIEIIEKDLQLGIKEFENCFFNRILHDPPSFKIAGELYSGELYGELFRVLEKGGKMFHYLGSPGTGRGIDIKKGAIKRLRAAGFGGIYEIPEALGIVAFKKR